MQLIMLEAFALHIIDSGVVEHVSISFEDTKSGTCTASADIESELQEITSFTMYYCLLLIFCTRFCHATPNPYY